MAGRDELVPPVPDEESERCVRMLVLWGGHGAVIADVDADRGVVEGLEVRAWVARARDDR